MQLRDLRDLGAAHLHGSARLAVRAREGDIGAVVVGAWQDLAGIRSVDVIVVWRYGAEEGAVLEQAVGIMPEVQSASSILAICGVKKESTVAQCDGASAVDKNCTTINLHQRTSFEGAGASPAYRGGGGEPSTVCSRAAGV